MRHLDATDARHLYEMVTQTLWLAGYDFPPDISLPELLKLLRAAIPPNRCQCGHSGADHSVSNQCTVEGCDCVGFTSIPKDGPVLDILWEAYKTQAKP